MKKAVLVIDDSKSVRQFISLALRQLGLKVVDAEDGMKALELIPHEDIGLIVTDLNMPNIDGLTFIRQIRSTEILKRIPIIVLTSMNDDRIKKMCREAGVSIYLTKPFNLSKIQHEVSKIFLQQ